MKTIVGFYTKERSAIWAGVWT